MQQAEHDKDIFIDADAPYGKENNFEQEVLRQMRRCVDVLSKEVVGGTLKTRTTKNGQREDYIEDVRELIVNGIDTFRILVKKWIKDEHEKDMKKIKEDLDNFQKELGERVTIVTGVGKVKIKELGAINKNNLVWREFIDYKADKYRKMFEILIDVYTKNKDMIRKFSEE